jgi:hypothetical protein
MNIEWSISKKRGNHRPILVYTIRLTDFEKSLGMPAVRIESPIPKPPDAGWSHCWPGQNERGSWSPAEFYLLMTPSFKTGESTERLKLPWREDNAYPEVEQAFAELRDAFEKVLAQSANSSPLKENGSLSTSGLAKKAVAPAFTAQRLLRAVQA